MRASVGVNCILAVVRQFGDFDRLRLALVEAWALSRLFEVVVISEGATFARIFAFAFTFAASFSAAFAFGFALALSGRLCIATARSDILRQVVVAGEQVGGEVEEIAG